MSRTDQWAITLLIILITLYLSAWITGLVIYKLPWLITLVNLLTGLSVIIFWIQKQLRITQHSFETREMTFLFVEFISVVVALYAMLNNRWDTYLKMPLYIVFGIHLLMMVFLLIFMFTFKMNKLF